MQYMAKWARKAGAALALLGLTGCAVGLAKTVNTIPDKSYNVTVVENGAASGKKYAAVLFCEKAPNGVELLHMPKQRNEGLASPDKYVGEVENPSYYRVDGTGCFIAAPSGSTVQVWPDKENGKTSVVLLGSDGTQAGAGAGGGGGAGGGAGGGSGAGAGAR